MIAPNLNVEKTIRQIIAKAKRQNNITLTPTCTFKDFGVDSLGAVQIMVAIEDAFDIDIVDKEMKTISNMGEFIDYVKSKIRERNQSCPKKQLGSWVRKNNGMNN